MACTCTGTTTITFNCTSIEIQITSGGPITGFVTITPGEDPNDIAADLNASSTNGSFTVTGGAGFFSITLSGFIVPTCSGPVGLVTINTQNGIGCVSGTVLTPGFLTCTVIPPPKKKKKRIGAWAAPAQVCIKADPNNPNFCPPEYVQYNRTVYELIGKDENGQCCYRIKR